MAISKELLADINYYAKLSKQRELTIEEKATQQDLRTEYLSQFKDSFKQVLDNVDVYKNLTVSFQIEQVREKLALTSGIIECKSIGISLTEITYDTKKVTSEDILQKLK